MNEKIIFNGSLVEKDAALLPAGNRGLRYGDGCFETLKVVRGNIALKSLHFNRLFSSLELLGFNLPGHFTPGLLEKQLLNLVHTNQHHDCARVRIAVFRGEGGIFETSDNSFDYTIESEHSTPVSELNAAGITVAVFEAARKVNDRFSHIKSNNYLPYSMAARWASEQKIDEAIVLNTSGRVADGTISNVFIIRDGIVQTPGLQEGCIAGVMRQHVISSCRGEGIPVEEKPISPEEMHNASAIFLTNAIRGIRWVRRLDNHLYEGAVPSNLFEKMVRKLWV